MTHHPRQHVLGRHPPRLQVQLARQGGLHLVDRRDVDPRHGGDLLQRACVPALSAGQRDHRGGQAGRLLLAGGGDGRVFEEGAVAQAVGAVLRVTKTGGVTQQMG